MAMGRQPVGFNNIEIHAEGVSGKHTTIRKDSDGFWVSDLGSRNGTFVNGEQVGSEPRLLTTGTALNWEAWRTTGSSWSPGTQSRCPGPIKSSSSTPLTPAPRA